MDKYIELNMQNYDEEQVNQLNDWGIWAYTRIATLERRCLELQKKNTRLEEELIDELNKDP